MTPTNFGTGRRDPFAVERALQMRGQESKTKQMRPWQKEAFARLCDSRCALVVAFCGSGKSLMQVALGIHDYVRHGQKQLIVVPQSHIADGFAQDGVGKAISVKLGRKTYNWECKNNFCDEKQDKVVQGIIDWLVATPEELASTYPDMISGINAICTHQALALAWQEIEHRKLRKKAIKNLTLRVDEAHHIDGVFDLNEEGLTKSEKQKIEEESTHLGKICRYIINEGDATSKLHLATATFYRGDRRMIFSPGVREKFDTYMLDWLQHWNTLGIENFQMRYDEYTGDPIKQVVSAIKEFPNRRHMVIVPPTGQKWRHTRDEEVNRLLSEIRKAVPSDQVLDLVTPATQERNKALLLAEPKESSGRDSRFRVVVTCMLGREGTDWVPCSMLHNTSVENSLTLAVQTAGRAFRYFPGKTEVDIRYYTKKFRTPKKGMTHRELITDRNNALLVCMQIDDMIHPIMMPPVTEINPKTGKKEKKVIPLNEVFGDQWIEFKTEMSMNYEELDERDQDHVDEMLEDLLEDYEIESSPQLLERLRLYLIKELADPTLKAFGIDVEFVRKEGGFDKVIKKYKMENRSIYFGDYSGQDFAAIRKIVKDKMRKFEETVAAVDAVYNDRLAKGLIKV